MLAGCGDSDSKATSPDAGGCPTVTPCGGNVVGTWETTQFCLTGAPPLGTALCPTGTTSVEQITGSATITFNADMTYNSSTTLRGNMTVTIPQICLQGFNCAILQGLLSQSLIMPDQPFSAITCTGTTDCTCTATLKGTPMLETGTYSTAGNVLTQAPTTTGNARTSALEYCVQDNELKVRSMPGASGTTDLPLAAVAVKKK